nr:hypothetical protein [Candidatus Sigynarchaeota archaeon]
MKKQIKTTMWICLIYSVFFVYAMLLLFSEPVQQGLLNFIAVFSTSMNPTELVWIYALIYLFMAIGNSTNIPIGIPAIYLFSKSLPSGDFLWFFLLSFAFVAGFGAATGELGMYVIGRGAGKALKNHEGVKHLQFFVRLITARRALAPFLVYLFGLTPLPDQMIIIPLGVAKYPVKRVILPCALGKGSFALIIAIGARFLNQAGPSGVTIQSLIDEALFLAIVLTVLVIFINVNWEPIFEKYSPKVMKESVQPAGNPAGVEKTH